MRFVIFPTLILLLIGIVMETGQSRDAQAHDGIPAHSDGTQLAKVASMISDRNSQLAIEQEPTMALQASQIAHKRSNIISCAGPSRWISTLGGLWLKR